MPTIPTDTPSPTEAETRRRAAADWFALHVFLADPWRVDRFLLEWVAPRARSLISGGLARGFFFVRYWEGGPHLRVRFQGAAQPVRDELLAAARSASAGFVSDRPPQRDDFYRNHGFDGRPVDVATLPWHPEGSVEAIAYEPEWVRYGGTQAMAINERLFDLSSTLCLALLRSVGDDNGRRVALAASVMPSFALAWRADVAMVASFFESYAAYWSAFSAQTLAFAESLEARGAGVTSAQRDALAAQVEAARTDSDAGRRTPQALLRAALREAIAQWGELFAAGVLVLPIDGRPARSPGAWNGAVQTMLSSQLHMMNNRLGLVPAQEVALARGIARTARALQAATALDTVLETLQ